LKLIKFNSSIILFFFTASAFLLNIFNAFAKEINTPKVENNASFNVRILLHENNSNDQCFFDVESKGKIIVSIPEKNQKSDLKTTNFKIISKKETLYFIDQNSNKKIKKIKFDTIKFAPTKNHYLLINKHPFQGAVTFKIDKLKHKIFAINTLNLEDYLYSVLISETYPTWPTEMHKVQAIVSRSYAVHCMLSARNNTKNPLPYDLKRTNFHQKYNGFHHYTHLRKAIDETKNMIMTYNNDVVLAMFDICCGGIIPAHMKSINFQQAPYLARKKQCTFCKGFKLYEWHNQISLSKLAEKLSENPKIAPNLKAAGKLYDVCILSKDKAGIVKKVKLACAKRNLIISCNDFCKTMRDKIKSSNFSLKKKKKNIIIDGRGYGHQTGLCQHGAKELINRGWNFRKVLGYYYPQIKFAVLKKYATV
jgi:stage II sporulation protein D